jgi:hypothetical protein
LRETKRPSYQNKIKSNQSENKSNGAKAKKQPQIKQTIERATNSETKPVE